MGNAIYHYDYRSYSGYEPNRVNLGDYIQSIAASQYFKKIDYTIDRDSLFDVKEQTNVIGNGWYVLDKERHTPSDCLNILPVSVHINNRSEEVVDIIKRISKGNPVGCRDVATLSFLQENRVDSYFSSCLTTTIDKKNITNSEKRSGIVFADLDVFEKKTENISFK